MFSWIRQLIGSNRQLRREIVERKRAVEALREAHDQLNATLDALPDLLFELDRHGRIYDFRAPRPELLYTSPSEFLGKTMSQVLPAEAASVIAGAINETMETGRHAGAVYSLETPAGTGWFELSMAAKGDPKASDGRLIMLVRDVTERAQAERAVRESQKRFLTVLDSIDAHVYAADLETYEILFMNKPMREDFGSNLIGEICWQVFRGAAGPCSHCTNDELLGAAGNPTGVHVWEGQNPITKKWYINYDRAIEWTDGRLVRLQIATDITERKQAEEKLRQYSVDLRERNEELDAFAHTAAHDLKSPLAYMVGYAELLKEDYAAQLDEEANRYLHRILRGGRKMGNIVDELLLLASVRGMEEVEPRPLDMADIVAEVRDRLSGMIERHQAEIILPERWSVALGYDPWVEEVWVNYLSNAIKYGGDPPRVELGFDVVDSGRGTEIRDRRSAPTDYVSMVRFWVRDNGPGLTPEEQARVFTPFERIDRMRAKGHGLGLSIVRRIVDKLGGQVGVESPAEDSIDGVGQGCVFWFTLPDAVDPSTGRNSEIV